MPFLVRDEMCHIYGLSPEAVRVVTARVGGGFGAEPPITKRARSREATKNPSRAS